MKNLLMKALFIKNTEWKKEYKKTEKACVSPFRFLSSEIIYFIVEIG